ncbi:MAG TPA: SDR family oxidoreductase [Steroidobacteraceae bacterium]|nr:SDR family oxidoreductase [Steroidobacteraceae bacterium]
MSDASTVRFDYSAAHVLVTGGTSGIGAGIAAAYREAGARVTITGTRPSAADYGSDLRGCAYLRLRLTEDGDIDAVAAALPRLDILVNNAGGNFMTEDEFDPLVFERSVRVNLTGAYRLAHACLPLLCKSTLPGGASVVGLASLTSYFGNTYVPGYGAAKAGLVQLTKSLAMAWAARNVRVNAVAAGFIVSRMMEYFLATPALAQPAIERTPQRRLGQPRDVAGAVLFLTSSAASFVTGQTLPVDGGYSVVG